MLPSPHLWENKQTYMLGKAWEKDPSLLNPYDGTKYCPVCEQSLYTVDFPNAPEYLDNKLPVCSTCYTRKKLASLVADVLDSIPRYRKCGKCDTLQPISGFAYSSSKNILQSTCRQCGKAYFDAIFRKEEAE